MEKIEGRLVEPQLQSHGPSVGAWFVAVMVVLVILGILDLANTYNAKRPATGVTQMAKARVSQVKVDCRSGDDYFRRLKANFTDREAELLTEQSVQAGCPKVVDIVRLKKPRQPANYAALRQRLQEMADAAEHTDDAMEGKPPILAKSEDEERLPVGITFEQRWQISGLPPVVRPKRLGRVLPA